MNLPKLSAKVWMGGAFWIAAILLSIFHPSVLVIVLAVFAIAFTGLALAATRAVQEKLPWLGRFPLVEDHGFRVVSAAEVRPQPATGQTRDISVARNEKRALLHLGRLLVTELDTCRLRIEKAIQTKRGWTTRRALPSEQFTQRSRSEVTASERDLNDHLGRFYIWADETNHMMRDREQREANAVGEILEIEESLELSDVDLGNLNGGRHWLVIARSAVQQRMNELSGS